MQSAADRETFEQVAYHWGDAYLFSYDETPGIAEPYSARRRDDDSAVLTAADPEALFDTVARDYRARPVPRDVAP